MLENRNERTWMAYLPFAKFAINSTASNSAGAAAFELILGYLTAAPVDRLDGLHNINSAQILVDRLYKAIINTKIHFNQIEDFQKK